MGEQQWTCEINNLHAVRSDGIATLNQMRLTIAQQSLTLRGGGFAVLNIWLIPAVFFGQGLHNLGRDIGFRTGEGTIAFTQADARLVKLHAQDDIARFDGAEKAIA